MDKAHITFVHEGKASYPDIQAFKKFFSSKYSTSECRFENLQAFPGKHACWHIMGFYPRRPNCDIVIHDYRSLSVGRLARFKDQIKRVANSTPDIRIFQNDEIRAALGFSKNENTFYLPMGVPDFYLTRPAAPLSRQEPKCDFIYIGSMDQERKCDQMIDSFLARYANGKTLHLYGPSNHLLERRYRHHENVRFMGFVRQEELASILESCRAAVAYFPNHKPHILQTPTKLMEYAALKMRIIANDQPQNRATAEKFGISCWWGPPDDMFKLAPDQLAWEDNEKVDRRAMAWSSVIAGSGVPEALHLALAGR